MVGELKKQFTPVCSQAVEFTTGSRSKERVDAYTQELKCLSILVV